MKKKKKGGGPPTETNPLKKMQLNGSPGRREKEKKNCSKAPSILGEKKRTLAQCHQQRPLEGLAQEHLEMLSSKKGTKKKKIHLTNS